jgi:hypothetical protein
VKGWPLFFTDLFGYKIFTIPEPEEIIGMKIDRENLKLRDNGGRRSGVDRRQYSYTLHIPERRSGLERRSGKDRRKKHRIHTDTSKNL